MSKRIKVIVYDPPNFKRLRIDEQATILPRSVIDDVLRAAFAPTYPPSDVRVTWLPDGWVEVLWPTVSRCKVLREHAE